MCGARRPAGRGGDARSSACARACEDRAEATAAGLVASRLATRRRRGLIGCRYLTRSFTFIAPALPSPAERPPTGPDCVHEIKHDGYRLMVRHDARSRLIGGEASAWQ